VELVVQKYGGSSLASPRHIQRAARRIKDLRALGTRMVVVVSAMGHTTDHLVKLARRTVAAPPDREMDMLLTAGERVSMSLLAMALSAEGVPAISFTGSQSGIITSNEHTSARIIDIKADRIKSELEKDKVVIIAGFQGVSREKEITTLGRGGSDTTAVAIAAALGANRCEILTDVAGLYTADPRIVPDAKLLDSCSYDECLELSDLGAKMHPRSIELAKQYGIAVSISPSYDDKVLGTRIGDQQREGNTMEETVVRGIAAKEGFHYFRVEMGWKNAVDVAKRHRVPLRFFLLGKGGVQLLCASDRASLLKDELTRTHVIFDDKPDVALVSAVGNGLCQNAEIIPTLLEVLDELRLEPMLITQSALSVSVAIPTRDKEAVCRALHSRFIPA
jgi:aspartate kinase